MKVWELIEILQEYDPNRLVICQKDAEGNGYSPLDDVEAAAYEATTTWMGEAYLEELTEELKESGFTEEDVSRNGVPALVLCPMN